jgi:glycosyltransferase involved in cell wall biosynthesis
MRVLHIGKFFPRNFGGIETHIRLLGSGLRQSIDLQVLVANDSRVTEESFLDGVPVTRAGTLFQFASTPFCPSMLRIVRNTQADLIHLHLPNPAATLVCLAGNRNVPLVISYHSDTVRHKALARGFEPFLHRALKRSAAIIASSSNNVENSPVLARYRPQCRVIPYGIQAMDFDYCDPRAVAQIRAEHGDRIVVAVGRLVYYKGFEYLIRAMRHIAGKLLIVGHGPMRRTLEKEIADCGVSERVALLGPRDDLLPYYHAADVFALPSISRTEAFGIVQLEAMACGKAVVNTLLPTGASSVSLNGVTGLSVPPADPTALAAAINLLLDDAPLRMRYGQAARRRVDQEFSTELMTERTLRLYHEVLDRPWGGMPKPPARRNGSQELPVRAEDGADHSPPRHGSGQGQAGGGDMFEMKARKAPGVKIRQVGDESVILDLKTERYLGLDDVATRMWDALLRTDSVEEAYQELTSTYRVDPAQLRQDLERLVGELVQQGILELQKD